MMMAIGLAVFPTVAGFNEVLFAVSSCGFGWDHQPAGRLLGIAH
ncbi:hypothetical protein ACN2CC_03500 [Mesorhizobium muleiense]